MASAVMNAPTANGEISEGAGTGVEGPAHTNSSLYVGDLDRDVAEAQLFEMFSKIGPVASIRVCRDAVTRRSLGYAYVNYNAGMDPGAAERALDILNYTPLNGKPMRIMWSLRDPATRKSGVGNIFIKNLDKSIDNKALHDTFAAFGPILSCKVATDATGQSKGYGFVHFEKADSAQMAMEKVNGMLLEGKKVYVGPFQKSDDRPAGHEQRYTNVFVKNLPESVDDEELQKMFQEYGPVTSAVVMKDNEDKSKGFGFVNFEKPESALKAVSELNNKEIDGKEIYCGRAQKKSEREAELKAKFDEVRQERIMKYAGLNLYVKNLVDDIDDNKLREQFAPFGTITSAKVMKDPNGKSKGFGFVCYSSPEEATRAVTELSNKMVMGKPMYVALAQRRDVRKAQLQAQYNPAATQPRPIAPLSGRPPAGPTPPMPGMFPPGQMPPPYGTPYYQPPGMAPPPRGPPGGAGVGPMYPGPMVPMGGRGLQGRGPPIQGRGPVPRGPPFPQPPGPYGPPPGPNFMPNVNFAQAPYPQGPGPRPNMMQQPRPGPMRPGRGFRQGPDHRPEMVKGRGAPGRGMRQPYGSGPPQPAPPAAAAPSVPAPSAVVPGLADQLTTAMLAAAEPEQQKQMLGERLYPLVEAIQPDLAGKITGMLLEMENTELLLLLESSEALQSKVDEAIQVLRQHNALPDGVGEMGPAAA